MTPLRVLLKGSGRLKIDSNMQRAVDWVALFSEFPSEGNKWSARAASVNRHVKFSSFKRR